MRRFNLADGDLQELVRDAQNGDQILLFTGACDDWITCKNGLIDRMGYRFRLNGAKTLYSGPFDGYCAHDDGVAINVYGKWLLNGLTEINPAELNISPTHFRNAPIMVNSNKIQSGVSVLFEGQIDGWHEHPHGVVVKSGDKFLLIVHKVL